MFERNVPLKQVLVTIDSGESIEITYLFPAHSGGDIVTRLQPLAQR